MLEMKENNVLSRRRHITIANNIVIKVYSADKTTSGENF